MKKTKLYRRFKPVEKHDTAAWANIKKLKGISQVSLPDEYEVENAKEWVDNNQK
ncbi:CDIF630_02480 family spore surface protein [Natranaerobius thermophilus]|uniref:DUF3787 domain-containing protein n=1 Tax=Natranaerobius thermophilus (strain ATCC BAA-1301 / DSM 18059 / JW/NM-WN-LF) TaxID=457570 RepID=B2A148_NATTJ|nr:DUF3787 domain-containing protein [Natranaerobius thermophilus]ACB84671.1 hypothetical protein Nther_1087 [Natranaerobius thermophilus JW/NM-WN-LF]